MRETSPVQPSANHAQPLETADRSLEGRAGCRCVPSLVGVLHREPPEACCWIRRSADEL